MSTEMPRKTFDRKAELRQYCRRSVASTDIARRIWEDVLTETQRLELGGAFQRAIETHDTIKLWLHAKGGSRVRALYDIAKTFGMISDADHQALLRDAGESLAGEAGVQRYTEILDSTVPKVELAILERPQEFFFKGICFDAVQWERRQSVWAYFWALSRSSRFGQALDHSQVKAGVRPNYLATQKHRLKGLSGFPPQLANLIVPAGGRTQRLDIAAKDIRVFISLGPDTFKEVLSMEVET